MFSLVLASARPTRAPRIEIHLNPPSESAAGRRRPAERGRRARVTAPLPFAPGVRGVTFVPESREATRKHSESVEIASPAEAVWQLLIQPERWFEGYVETRSRSPDYPRLGTHNDYLFHTRVDEQVYVSVVRSGAPTLLEERHEGKTFSRQLRYRLTPIDSWTRLMVEDELSFKGLAKLASPLAFRDVKRRWARSLERLRAVAETTA